MKYTETEKPKRCTHCNSPDSVVRCTRNYEHMTVRYRKCKDCDKNWRSMDSGSCHGVSIA
jgi:hypothetical protein